MNPYTEHGSGLTELQSEMGDSCPTFIPLWHSFSDPIKILPGGVRTKKDNSTGGLSLDSDLQLTCLLADFGNNPPPSRGYFTYQGQKLRITSVTPGPNAVQVRINADNAGQKL